MKSILITGASSGIGKATAEILVQAGNKVLLTGRREAELQQLADELGENASYTVLDVTDGNAIVELFEHLPKGFEELDVVINNAGLALNADPTPDMPVEDWDTMVDTNIKGLMHVSHAALKLMKHRKSGHIINIGSVAGIAPYRGGNVYGATKAFVGQLSKNLRTDTLGDNIRITNILPGAVNTEFSTVRFKGDKTKADSVYAGYRELHAEDVANAIVWAIDQPDHVNIDAIEIMPTDQTYAGTKTSAQT